MKLSLPLTDFIILALALQGFVLSGLLFYSSRKIPANKWIAAFIFVVSESTLIIEIDYSGLWQSHKWMIVLMLPLRMLLGPLIYFYVRGLIWGESRPVGKRWIHFLPVMLDMKHQLIYLFYITGILSVPFVQDIYFSAAFQRFLFVPGFYDVLPALISFACYTAVTYKMVNRQLAEPTLSAYKQADLRWVKNLLHLMSALMMIWITSIVAGYASTGGAEAPWTYYMLYFPAIVFVYWLGMATYRRQGKIPEVDIPAYTAKQAKAYFSETDAGHYLEQLTRLMETDRIYLNPLLKVDDVANKLSVPEKTISSLLNQRLGKNFNDMVNSYRVEEAMKRLADPAYKNLTIAGIAFDCGFNSLPTFQRAFKQHTGLTPSQYQNSLKKNAQIPI